jgi:hypothetical protein
VICTARERWRHSHALCLTVAIELRVSLSSSEATYPGWVCTSEIPAHASGARPEIMINDPRTTEPLDRRIRAACKAALPGLGAVICVLAVSGCAGNAPQPETRSEPIRSGAAAPEPQMCRIDRALLVPAHAPDCGFGRSDLKTLDPEQWSHLKIEFEKKCYQHAEKMIRERLRQLQVASRCGIEQASR